MKKYLEIEVELPSLPNYLRSKNGHMVIAINQCTSKELQDIGEKWTKELIKKAKTKRK